MPQQNETAQNEGIGRVLVEFESLEDAENTINPSVEEAGEADDEMGYPELQPVFDAIADAYNGLKRTTEEDGRGRMRHIVKGHAGREEMGGSQFGNHLRVLEEHGLAENNGKRWRVSSEKE